MESLILPSRKDFSQAGINGTMEYIFTVTSIVEHAKLNGMQVKISLGMHLAQYQYLTI